MKYDDWNEHIYKDIQTQIRERSESPSGFRYPFKDVRGQRYPDFKVQIRTHKDPLRHSLYRHAKEVEILEKVDRCLGLKQKLPQIPSDGRLSPRDWAWIKLNGTLVGGLGRIERSLSSKSCSPCTKAVDARKGRRHISLRPFYHRNPLVCS
jgi:hypothetical protein